VAEAMPAANRRRGAVGRRRAAVPMIFIDIERLVSLENRSQSETEQDHVMNLRDFVSLLR
jgi:hypothetical protein